MLEKIQKVNSKRARDFRVQVIYCLQMLYLLHKQGIQFVEPTDLSGAVKGRPNIYTHLETMLKDAEKKQCSPRTCALEIAKARVREKCKVCKV